MEIEMKSTFNVKHLITDVYVKRETARKSAWSKKPFWMSKLYQLNQLLIKQKNDDR